jgi:hypothetical protein
MRKPLILVLALCLPIAFVAGDIGAQGGEVKSSAVPPQQGEGKSGKSGSAGVEVGDGGGGEAGSADDPTPAEAVVFTGRGAQFFSALGAVRPRRLAPGETGTLHVVVTLRPGRVVLPDAHIVLSVKEGKGPWVLGSTQVKPARLAEYAKHYAGKPVYDDTIEFEVPLTVAEDAKHQKVNLAGYVQLDVTDGGNGESLGRIAGALTGRVHIGSPLPRPGIVKKARKVADKTKGSDSEGSAPVIERRASPQFEGGSDVAAKTGSNLAYEETSSEDAKNSGGDTGTVDPDLSSGKSYWPMLAGLALLLLVVFLFLRGKR